MSQVFLTVPLAGGAILQLLCSQGWKKIARGTSKKYKQNLIFELMPLSVERQRKKSPSSHPAGIASQTCSGAAQLQERERGCRDDGEKEEEEEEAISREE